MKKFKFFLCLVKKIKIKTNSIQFNSIQFNFINPNGHYKLLLLLRTIEQELKKTPTVLTRKNIYKRQCTITSQERQST
jgi:hypothetical protein